MRYLLIMAFVVTALGCDSNPGPDSITSHTGAVLVNCADCHLSPDNIAPNPLVTNGSGTAGKHVAHVTSMGLPCFKCHFNYAANAAHSNGVVNVKGIGPAPVYFDATNPAGVWSYITPSGPGTCSSTICHKSLTPDWYGTVVPPQDPICSNCHNDAIGSRRQVLGSGGDFASNLTVTSHHVSGFSDPSAAQCAVCHDQSLHMGGTVRLSHADTGIRIDYDPLQPSTLEPFCISCHDEDGALLTTITITGRDPFNDGVTLGTMPFVASSTIASSWTGSSTHRSRGLTCAGNGAPNTGCHGRNGAINAHGSINKGLLTNTMNFQIPLVSAGVYTPNPLGSSDYANNYKLCFDCHASYPAVAKEVVLGYRSGGVYNIQKAPTPYYTLGMQSLFRDRYIGNPANYPVTWGGLDQFYNDFVFSPYPFLALHNYHLLGFQENSIGDPTVNMLQWNYRGDPARIGRITCTACHNVHGTLAATIRSTHRELGLAVNARTPPFPGESYTSLSPLISPAIMTSFPLNCAVDCHGNQGQSSYWHTPNGD